MKQTFLLLIAILFQTTFAKASDDAWRIYVTTFITEDAELTAIANEVSDDFQLVLQNCNKRFQVLDRATYISWIEEANNETADESKLLLQLQDIDYLIRGEIIFNDLKQKYTIEYAFEEVKTGYQSYDNLNFETKAALEDREKRYKTISDRIINDFKLCQKKERAFKAKMVEIKVSVKHEMVDKDKDGIPDLIDEERDTPIGALVNSRGKAYTEEELEVKRRKETTPKEKTEEEKKQDEIEALMKQMMPDMPSIPFLSNTNRVEEEAYTQLHQVAKVMEMYPAIRVIVKGNSKESSNVMAYQRSYNTITYLMEHYDIPQKRLILAYGESEDDDTHTVMFDISMKENLEDMSEPDW